MNNKIFTLNGCVWSVMNELRMDSTKDFDYLLQLAVEGFRDLKLYAAPNVKVAYIKITDAGIVYYPADMVTYTKVAIRHGRRLITLTRDERLAMPESLKVCDTPPHKLGALHEQQLGQWYFPDHVHNGSVVSGLFSLGGGVNAEGYYRDDPDRRQIYIAGGAGGEVVMEYVSNGVDLCGDTYIGAQWVEPVKMYIHWKRLDFSPTVPMNEKRWRYNNYSAAIEKAKTVNSPSEEEFFDLVWAGHKQTPKR